MQDLERERSPVKIPDRIKAVKKGCNFWKMWYNDPCEEDKSDLITETGRCKEYIIQQIQEA